MESGKFAALFVVAIVALGGIGWYSFTSIDDLRQEIAQVDAKNAATSTLASQSIKSLDNVGAQVQKLNKQLADLTKQTQDSTAMLTDTQSQVKDISAQLDKRGKPASAKIAERPHRLTGSSGSSTSN